jgi:hypothetical protein
MLAALCLAMTLAQAPDQPPPEHLGFGGYVGVGTGAIVSGRFSAPFHPRGGLDLDVGRLRRSGRTRTTFGAAVRWLRRERRPDGLSDYGIFGILVTDGLGGQIGYGFDGQAGNGTRIGLEFTGGGSGGEALNFTVFARFFVVWGPAMTSGR